MIKIIPASDPEVESIISQKAQDEETYLKRVKEIIEQVKVSGDEALFELTARFDGVRLTENNLKVSKEEISEAYSLVDKEFLSSIELAKSNITKFHQKQLNKSWMEPGSEGEILGQLIKPLKRVGIYVPGGTACYPSSVLMNAIPAKVAGVQEIAMVTPPGKDGRINPYTLAAAEEAGVTEIYKVGGAQAVAALAFGTSTIKKVDKITGPGNIYVTLAKKEVYGQVDIDMLAGPSEILIVADQNAKPDYLAADLLSQAEHDVLASAILVTPSKELALKVQVELDKQTAQLSRKDIIKKSIGSCSAIIITKDLEEAFQIANKRAPEHLEIMVDEPVNWLWKVENAGAVFLGPYSPEPVGDYVAGPNHVLPTGGTARFYSPLNVDTFIKKTSIIFYSQEKLSNEGERIINFAKKEGLDAHANAVSVRLKDFNQ